MIPAIYEDCMVKYNMSKNLYVIKFYAIFIEIPINIYFCQNLTELRENGTRRKRV